MSSNCPLGCNPTPVILSEDFAWRPRSKTAVEEPALSLPKGPRARHALPAPSKGVFTGPPSRFPGIDSKAPPPRFSDILHLIKVALFDALHYLTANRRRS